MLAQSHSLATPPGDILAKVPFRGRPQTRLKTHFWSGGGQKKNKVSTPNSAGSARRHPGNSAAIIVKTQTCQIHIEKQHQYNREHDGGECNQ